MTDFAYEPWPAFDYHEFKSTGYLLHMATQAIGKLKLTTPFEPHWSNVALWLTTRGLTTGLIPYQNAAFSIELDMIGHQIHIQTTWGSKKSLAITSMSVAELTQQFFSLLQQLNITITINPMPQEIANPISFNQDRISRAYDPGLANAWWRILVSTHRVMKRYHSHFDGETPPIGLMWGTFDLRDARYNGKPVQTSGANAGYIRRNAMNEAQVEVGFWPGNELYPHAAYFSFTYPQPPGIAQAKVKPEQAHWDDKLGEFILTYDELRKTNHPEKNLLEFFESTFKAGSTLAGWDQHLITSGEPV